MYPIRFLSGFAIADGKRHFVGNQVEKLTFHGYHLFVFDSLNKRPESITAIWYSFISENYYFTHYDIPSQGSIPLRFHNSIIIICILSDGYSIIWEYNMLKIFLIGVTRGIIVNNDVQALFVENKNMLINWLEGCNTPKIYFQKYFSSDLSLIDKGEFSENCKFVLKYIMQYSIRYRIDIINNNGKVADNGFDYIEEMLYDGTHDKLHDGGLMQYHKAGRPKKLAIRWHIKKVEYLAHFWFEDDRIREVFDKFYGAHPDTKTDFIIRIDSEQRKYELALYRYGLKEPQIIPEDVYQLIVFKNKFEDYRSENYNQEHGAWIW